MGYYSPVPLNGAGFFLVKADSLAEKLSIQSRNFGMSKDGLFENNFRLVSHDLRMHFSLSSFYLYTYFCRN